MNLLRKTTKWTLRIACIALFTTFVYLYLNIFPKIHGTEVIKNKSDLFGQVSITRDKKGVAHIQAEKNDLDAYFALGVAHAQDRFWQMELQRRTGQGRLSEIIGEKTLEYDKFMRTWGFYNAAQKSWDALDSKTQQILHSYTRGINYFINNNKLPIEIKILNYKPEPWTYADSIVVGKLLALDLNKSWQDKIIRYRISLEQGNDMLAYFHPKYPANAPTTLSNEDIRKSLSEAKSKNAPGLPLKLAPNHSKSTHLSEKIPETEKQISNTIKINSQLGYTDSNNKGSNFWVISGKHTESGKPLLANDPHLVYHAPNRWYLASINGPDLNVKGASVPGIPAIIIGNNQNIGWGVTNADLNTSDLYIETDPADLASHWEVIKVKNKPDYQYQILKSKKGPVITNVTATTQKMPKMSASWTALDSKDTSVESLIKINYAKNWNDFTQALQKIIAPAQNFAYADIEGNIGYYLAGKVPLRKYKDEVNSIITPYQKQEWTGYIPFSEMPHSYNPDSGIIVSANNKPITDNYPHDLNYRWKAPPYRAQRIIDLLKYNTSFTIDDLKKIQLDIEDYQWHDFKEILLKTHPLDQASHDALNILSTWDGSANLTSSGPTIFEYWYQELKALYPYAKFDEPSPLYIKNQLTSNGQYCRKKISKAKSCSDALSISLENAMNKLMKQLGNNPEDWQWQNFHKAGFKSLVFGESKIFAKLFNRSIAAPGNHNTLNSGGRVESKDHSDRGTTYREIIDFSDLDNSLFIHALGQSGNPFNNNYDDLLQLWRDGKYLKIKLEMDKIRQYDRLVLKP